jgi:hypothetical protein
MAATRGASSAGAVRRDAAKGRHRAHSFLGLVCQRAAFLVVIALAACAAPEAPPPVATSQPAAASAAIVPAPASMEPGESTLGRLQAMTQGEVRRLLGEPDFRRHDAPAEFWQYRTASCTLDLFLYPEPLEYRVAYVAARSDSAIAPPAQACLAELMGGHRRAAGL